MTNFMIIPKTITVGYNNRKDTYTGKLAYVIYTDDKGKLRKEKSWQSWRNTKLGRDDFKNEPTSGFVLNKGVGGVRQSYGWNARNEYIRVYDPRNFEFEISVANLLFILQESSSIKGKGLEGEFVYSWDGTQLVLLPVNSDEYKECVKWNDRQKIKINKSEVVEGCSYLLKDNTEAMYLGFHQYNNCSGWNYFNVKNLFSPTGKKHIFRKLNKDKYDPEYIVLTGYTKIAERLSTDPSPQFANEYEKFIKSMYYGEIKKIDVKPVDFVNKITDRNLLVKDGNNYYLAKVVENYSNYNYHPYNDTKLYNFLKSSKPFDFKLKSNKLQFTKLLKSDINVKIAEIRKKDLYIITAITKNNIKLEVI